MGDLLSGSGSASPAYDFYTNPFLWTFGAQYATSQLSIPIVNGKAKLTIPANETVAALFVEASYPIPNTKYQAIRAEMVMVRNPLMIGGLTPYSTTPSGNPEDRYELGGFVTWKDGKEGVIEDNTTINYSLITPANPSVSATDNGWAGGIFLGPKDQIVVQENPNAVCDPEPLEENISIEIIHSSGWSMTINRVIYWVPVIESSNDPQFYFKVSEGVTGWADGELNPPATVVSDLDDAFNQSPAWVGSDGIERLKGFDQPDDLSRQVIASGASPRSLRWNNGLVEFYHAPSNLSLGYHPKGYGKTPGSDYKKPWDITIALSTSYYQSNGQKVYGAGLTDLPTPTGLTGFSYPRPVITFKEPLEIEMEAENGYVRDGFTTGTIVAEATWKGSPITNKFILNEGLEGETIIDYPFPIVTFKSGKCTLTNSTGGEKPRFNDNRGTFGCCLDVELNPDAKLSSYSVQTGLFRTSKYDASGDEHTHACTVDEDGNGITTSTITTNGATIPDHTHTIVNYAAETSLYGIPAVPHIHELRCVAITNLLPTSNTDLTISVIAIVEYDPTNCSPYTGGKSGVGSTYPLNGNRAMFTSLDFNPLGLDQEPTEPELVLELTSLQADQDASAEVPTYYAAETLDDYVKGFNIRAKAYFTSYYESDGVGGVVLVPERDVDDGSRITVEYKVFLPASSLNATDEVTDVVITGPDVKRNYMWLVVKSSIATEGRYTEAELQIAIDSNLNWLPGYRALVSDPTNDLIYVANAVSYAETMGSSAMFDAIRLAAKRMIKWQELNAEVQDYKKAVILLTDGDENKSEFSLNKAITSVSFMDGDNTTPIISVRLGQSYSADEVVLIKMAIDSEGFVVSSFDIESAVVGDLVDFMFTNEKWIVGHGTYHNEFKLDKPSIPSKLSLKDVFVPSGSNVEFRYRTSLDKKHWELWSDWLLYSEQHSIAEDIDSKTLYFEYDIRLSGTSEFTSPEVRKDISISYFDPSDFAMFFNPISAGGGSSAGANNEDGDIGYGIEEGKRFLSSIHITHEVDVPTTSTIGYGITQSDSNDIDAFYSTVRPDEHTILLTRYNEPLVTDDNRVYTALNGNWPDKVEVSIYKINSQYPNGVFVDPSEYATNNIEGIVTFYAGQDENDQFVVSIEVYPSFRLACRVTNFGSKRAIIHHIGIIYNMMKRIPTDDNGNIIHTPINSRIS